jgi:hypothetical protein
VTSYFCRTLRPLVFSEKGAALPELRHTPRRKPRHESVIVPGDLLGERVTANRKVGGTLAALTG